MLVISRPFCEREVFCVPSDGGGGGGGGGALIILVRRSKF